MNNIVLINQLNHLLYLNSFLLGLWPVFLPTSFSCFIILKCLAIGTPNLGDSIHLPSCSCYGSYKILLVDASESISPYLSVIYFYWTCRPSYLTFRDLELIDSIIRLWFHVFVLLYVILTRRVYSSSLFKFS